MPPFITYTRSNNVKTFNLPSFIIYTRSNNVKTFNLPSFIIYTRSNNVKTFNLPSFIIYTRSNNVKTFNFYTPLCHHTTYIHVLTVSKHLISIHPMPPYHILNVLIVSKHLISIHSMPPFIIYTYIKVPLKSRTSTNTLKKYQYSNTRVKAFKWLHLLYDIYFYENTNY